MCSGGATLAPEDRAEMLAVLALDQDEEIAERAQSVLLTQPVESILLALARLDADPRLFTYCAENAGQRKGIADALAKHPRCPTTAVTRVAPHLTAGGIQALLNDLERFISDTELIAAVCGLEAATPEQRETFAEMQKGPPDMKEIEEAAVEVIPDVAKRKTLMQRLTQMNVVQRLTLALKGDREARMLLIRDSNKLVQRCVLQSPRLSDTEVEGFAKMTNISEEALRTISLTRKFMKSYVIARNLVTNPKVPLDISLHLLPRLTATDLKLLTTNKNIPDTLRSSAVKLQRQRTLSSITK